MSLDMSIAKTTTSTTTTTTTTTTAAATIKTAAATNSTTTTATTTNTNTTSTSISTMASIDFNITDSAATATTTTTTQTTANTATTLYNSAYFATPTTLTEFNISNDSLSDYPGYQYYSKHFDIEYVAKINPFWLKFPPPSPYTFYIFAYIYIGITLIGCSGNAFVLFMFAWRKSLRTPSNFLVMNLSVCDLLMLIKCPIAAYNNFKQGPALGDAACRIYGFLGGLSGTAAIGTLTAIAYDRYNVVVHPLEPLRNKARWRTPLLIVAIWTYSFIFSIIPALDIGLSVYVPEGYLTTCGFDYLNKESDARTFMFSFFAAAYCVPLTIITFCYFYILKVVFDANKIQSNKNNLHTEQKLTALVGAIISLWFIAWTPYAVVAMTGVFGYEDKLSPLASMIPAIFCKSAACIDPYLYAATHPRFRAEVNLMFFGRPAIRRMSTTRSSCITRSSNRRRRIDMDARVHIAEQMNNNLTIVPEDTEENEEFDMTVDISNSPNMQQSKF